MCSSDLKYATAMAIAVAYFAATLIGGGAGPIITGALSDMFSQRVGVEGLRLAMVVSMIPVAAAGLVFWRFGHLMRQDAEV